MWNETLVDESIVAARRRLRVLIADDHHGTRRSLQLLLRWLECSCHVVEDGREALDAVRSGGYDVIIMDVVMPRMDGLEATRQIRQVHPYGGGPRIVGISADTTPEDRRICLDVGMDNFLPKPLDVEALIQILDEVARQLVPAC